MQFKHLYAYLAIGLGCLLSSCHSDIDLKNVDTTMEAQVKLALPIGGFKAKVSDFLGSNDSVQIYLDENGVLTFKTEFHEKYSFDDFDMSSKLADTHFTINLYKRLQDATYKDEWGIDHPIIQGGNMIIYPDNMPDYTDSIIFDMPMRLPDINKPGQPRVDSVLFNTANFDVTIDRKDFPQLDWSWVDRIIIDLGTGIDRHGKSQRMELYTKGVTPITDFAQNMAMNMDNITMHLTKDRHAEPGMDNVVDSLVFKTIVYYRIPSPTNANINSTSGLDCNFKKRKIDIEAIWGWDTNTKDMKADGTVNIDSLMGTIAMIKKINIPLTSPEISIQMATMIAGQVKLDGQLYTIDKNDQKHYAKFYGNDFFRYSFPGVDPSDLKTLGDTSKMSLTFDNSYENGEIHHLFEEFPSKLGYKINCNFDEESTPQIRIQNDLSVNLDASIKIPFSFNKGLNIELQDTIRDIEISQYHIDSLLSSVQFIDSVRIGEGGVWLLMNITDSIPMDIYATLTCLNKDKQPIEDPEIPGRNFILFPETGSDTIRISAFGEGGTLLKCQLTQKRLNLFKEIKGIAYMVGITDAAASSAGTVIEGKNSLSAQIALTADLHAYMDPFNKNK
jgi:hypothetical protein